MQETLKIIKKQINNNKLIIYMKGTPSTPMCGFSIEAIRILNFLNLEYVYINVLEDVNIRRILPTFSNWPTFPQLFYKTKLIGGIDVMTELHKKEKLKTILTK